MKDLSKLPDNLPVPIDDGACDHLLGAQIPSMFLEATNGERINLGKLPGVVVIYFYPMIGRPDSPPLLGWNEIPGARGCTPQSCAFRDSFSALSELGAQVFGVSAQPLEDQQEAQTRLHLPFQLLNDSSLSLAGQMCLPTFEYKNLKLIKRVTLIAKDGVIKKVFYPVFPTNSDAGNVIQWLSLVGA